MMTFRKLAAESAGKLLRAYFTEEAPQPDHDFRTKPGQKLDSSGRLTSYYTGRDSRAVWRPDMAENVAAALGINPRGIPKDSELDRLFEAKRGDNGLAWSDQKRKISAFDLTLAPHKSISLAAEFAATDAESAMIWHAIDRANDATMRYVAKELGWARKGKAGEDGAEQGEVAWVSFRHHTARPTLPVQDGPDGATYLATSPIGGDPHAHIHNALFNVVVTDDGRVGSLDSRVLTGTRVHEFGAYFQAVLADELRMLGAKVGYDKNEQAVVLETIPQAAVDLFSKGRRQVLQSAKDYAKSQGLDWETMTAEGKFKILSVTGLASRLKKHGEMSDREIWREQAEAIGWKHETILSETKPEVMADDARYRQAYEYAARHLATEFETAAVIDHDRLRMYAARGLIGTGIAGGTTDIARVAERIEKEGIELRGERVALQSAEQGGKLRVTNTAQIQIERRLGSLAKKASSDRAGALAPEAIRKAIESSGLDFDRDPEHGRAQRAAIYALGQGSALTLLTGMAGSGKTTLLKPLVTAWKADTRFDEGGREVIGLATGWRQADALREAGIKRTIAISPLLQSIESGKFEASRNTVLVIDEIGQVAPRAMLALLELQQKTGLTIKGLGDREQAQAIEAGDAIELLQRALPTTDQVELLSTVRQTKARDRKIASLFRGNKNAKTLIAEATRAAAGPIAKPNDLHLAEVEEALAMKRASGTARFIGGDYDQVLERIADFYMERRDILAASGVRRNITISVLTNEDAANLSHAVRERMKVRGDIGTDETVHKAIDQRAETYDIAIATGDRLRLFRRTWAQIDGKDGSIGNNGDIVEVTGRWDGGLLLRDNEGRVGKVEWRRLKDAQSGRLLVGCGHAMTVDAAQGITSDEHINALPRGTAGMTGFKAYVAESRARGGTWTMISDGATFEAVRKKRALGDLTPIKAEDMWHEVAKNMAATPYKSLAIDLISPQMAAREDMVRGLMQDGHRVEKLRNRGIDPAMEFRYQMEAARLHGSLPSFKAQLDKAIADAEISFVQPMTDAEIALRKVRVDAVFAERNESAPRRRAATISPGM